MRKLAKLFPIAALIVKKASMDETAECQVEIAARKQGFVAWLLSLLGIDSTFTMRVYRDRLESEEGSLSGRIKTVIPVDSLDSYVVGFTKPFLALVLGVISLFASIGLMCSDGNNTAGVVVLLVLAIAWIAGYFFNRCLVLDFSSNGVNSIGLLIKTKKVGGVKVDEDFIYAVGEIVKKNYLSRPGK